MQPNRLLRPFGAFGVVVGLAAGSLFLPNGCAISGDQSLRLRCGAPIGGVLLLVLLVAALGLTRKTRWAFAMALAAAVLWCADVTLLYGGPRELALIGIAAVYLAPLLAGILVLTPLSHAWMSRARGARAGLARAEQSTIWALSAALANLSVGVLYVIARQAIDGRLAWAAGLGTIAMALAGAYHARRVERHLEHAETAPIGGPSVRIVALDAPLPDAVHLVDWGIGAWRQDGYAPGPRATAARMVWIGDRTEALRRLRQDRKLALIAFGLSLAGMVAAGAAIPLRTL